MCMYDTIIEQLPSAVENIRQLLCSFEEKGLLTGPVKTVNNAMCNIKTSNSLAEAMEGTMFLQVMFALS